MNACSMSAGKNGTNQKKQKAPEGSAETRTVGGSHGRTGKPNKPSRRGTNVRFVRQVIDRRWFNWRREPNQKAITR